MPSSNEGGAEGLRGTGGMHRRTLAAREPRAAHPDLGGAITPAKGEEKGGVGSAGSGTGGPGALVQPPVGRTLPEPTHKRRHHLKEGM